jgi:hypothetical protein
MKAMKRIICSHDAGLLFNSQVQLNANYEQLPKLTIVDRPVRLAYQPPASSTFLSQQISHQQPASSTLLSEQTSTSH